MKLIISKSRYPNLRANLSEVVLRAISLVRFGRLVHGLAAAVFPLRFTARVLLRIRSTDKSIDG